MGRQLDLSRSWPSPLLPEHSLALSFYASLSLSLSDHPCLFWFFVFYVYFSPPFSRSFISVAFMCTWCFIKYFFECSSESFLKQYVWHNDYKLQGHTVQVLPPGVSSDCTEMSVGHSSGSGSTPAGWEARLCACRVALRWGPNAFCEGAPRGTGKPAWVQAIGIFRECSHVVLPNKMFLGLDPVFSSRYFCL